MTEGRVCPGMQFWNKVTGKCCCLTCPLEFSRVLSLPRHSPPPPCARSEVKVYFWLPSKGRGWGETGFLHAERQGCLCPGSTGLLPSHWRGLAEPGSAGKS